MHDEAVQLPALVLHLLLVIIRKYTINNADIGFITVIKHIHFNESTIIFIICKFIKKNWQENEQTLTRIGNQLHEGVFYSANIQILTPFKYSRRIIKFQLHKTFNGDSRSTTTCISFFSISKFRKVSRYFIHIW